MIVALVGFRAKREREREREREECHKILPHKFCNNPMDGKKNPLLRSECCISGNQSREIREEHHKLLSHKRWLFMRVRVCVHVWGCVRVRACMHVCVYVII